MKTRGSRWICIGRYLVKMEKLRKNRYPNVCKKEMGSIGQYRIDYLVLERALWLAKFYTLRQINGF